MKSPMSLISRRTQPFYMLFIKLHSVQVRPSNFVIHGTYEKCFLFQSQQGLQRFNDFESVSLRITKQP